MCNQISRAVPAQNFSVAYARSRSPVNPPVSPLSIPANIVRLEFAQDAAWLRWWHLYCAPDVWLNAAVKREMCLARLEYQDSVFEVAAAYAVLHRCDIG